MSSGLLVFLLSFAQVREVNGGLLAHFPREIICQHEDIVGEHGHLDIFHIVPIEEVPALGLESDPTSAIAGVVNFGKDFVNVMNVEASHTLPEGSRSGPKCYLDSP